MRESLFAAVLASSAAFAGEADPSALWSAPTVAADGGPLAVLLPWVVQTVLVWGLAEASRALAARRRRRARRQLGETGDASSREPVTRAGTEGPPGS